MSLAYKLWKIGSVLTKNDIKTALQEKAEFKNGEEPIYLNIDFKFKENRLASITLKKEAISKEKFFFTKKIGGSGTGIYYLYPNIMVVNDKPILKLGLLTKTLEKCIFKFCDIHHQKQVAIILYSMVKTIVQFTNSTDDNVMEKLEKSLKKTDKRLAYILRETIESIND